MEGKDQISNSEFLMELLRNTLDKLVKSLHVGLSVKLLIQVNPHHRKA